MEKPSNQNMAVIVAVVGGDTIRLGEFKEFARLQGVSGSDLHKLSVRKQMMDQLVYKYLLKQFVVGEGLMEDPRILNKKTTSLEEMIASKVRQRDVYDAFITDSVVADVHRQMGEELRVRHILISYREAIIEKGKWLDKEVARRTRERAHELADSISSELKKNPEKFEAFVGLFSNDENTQFLEGDLGYVSFGRVHPAMWDLIWEAPVGVPSDPIETNKGFHILKIMERRPIEDRKPLEVVRGSIRAYVAARYVAERHPGLLAAQAAYEDGLMAQYEYQPVKPVVEKFLKKYARIKESGELGSIFGERERDENLATFKGGRIAVKELVWEMEDNMVKVKLDERRMMEGLRRIALTRILGNYGLQKGFTLTAEDSARADRSSADAAEELAHRTHIELKLSADEKELRKFYENRKSDYSSPAVIDYMEIYGSDSARVQMAYSEIQHGGGFDAVYQKASSAPGFKCRRTGWMPENAIEDIQKVTSSMGVGDISRPFRRPQGGYTIIRLMSRNPGMTSRFEEVRDRVKADFLTTERRRRMLEWMEQLRIKHPTQIFESNLTEVYSVNRN